MIPLLVAAGSGATSRYQFGLKHPRDTGAAGRDGMREAEALLDTLPPSPSRRVRMALDSAAPAVQHRSRQLSIRVTQAAYRDLEVASAILGGTPTQIARMLINAGVRRLLAEHDVALDEARRGGNLGA